MKVYLSNEDRTEVTLVPLTGAEELFLVRLVKLFVHGGLVDIVVKNEPLKGFTIPAHGVTGEEGDRLIREFIGESE